MFNTQFGQTWASGGVGGFGGGIVTPGDGNGSPGIANTGSGGGGGAGNTLYGPGGYGGAGGPGIVIIKY
jgi:hypothetical protein